MAVSNLHGRAVQAQQTERTGLESSWSGAVLSVTRRWFQQPSPRQMAERELEEAKRARLQALSARDYAESMVIYHASRIDRLTVFLEIEQ